MTLESVYALYREPKLNGLWIHYEHIAPLIEKLNKDLFNCSIVGYSENNVPIHSISLGTGRTKILLWSQMHGDESTATKSLFDIFNYIAKEYQHNEEIITLLNSCTLVFIPILNPDGAFAYTRENANGIDLNRDAKDLDTKEAAILHKLVTTEKPAFAFNLHDQTSWYNVANTDKVATLSFLSPAADPAKTVTNERKTAMSVIVAMRESLKDYLPHQIGRYNDTFCDNCFGDNIQKMGFPTILVESGYFPGDKMREKTRKFHSIALVTALFSIAKGNLPSHDAYIAIPMNEKNYYDTRVDNIIFKGRQTSVGVRYKYIVQSNKLVKVIDSEETIAGGKLANKYFHQITDAKGKKFTDLF